MTVFEVIMLVVLLVSALFIVVAVVLQKSNEDGLSGTIAGGNDTFYSKDKSSHTDRMLFKWTLIASVVFVLAVIVVFVMQPDFSSTFTLDKWLTDSSYSHVAK